MQGALMVGVASTSLEDRKSTFSTYSIFKVEVTAVGENVASAAPENRMGVWNGTSMAAPMVSGAFALALAQRSFGDLTKLGKAIADTDDGLVISDVAFGVQLGGRLNLERFLQTVLNPSFQ